MDNLTKLKKRINDLFLATNLADIQAIENAYTELTLSFTVDNKFIQNNENQQVIHFNNISIC
jgi:hypothetical protein